MIEWQHKVVDFVEYIKLKEDNWFIDLVNQRGEAAKIEQKTGEKPSRLQELKKQYR
jgi:hypothetical protein